MQVDPAFRWSQNHRFDAPRTKKKSPNGFKFPAQNGTLCRALSYAGESFSR
jgi:hypothetical protein